MPAQKLVDKHSLRILNMEPVMNIPSNASHQRLMNGGEDSDSTDSGVINDSYERETVRVKGNRSVTMTPHEILTVAILTFVNLINYMDRYTIAGVLGDVLNYYDQSGAAGGSLQSVFILSYMVFAPIFGYLGDRFSRRYVMAAGVFVWSMTTLAGSFMTNFYWFAFFRAIVGIGEASYSTIAPTVISDLFVGNKRTIMLMIFYFAIPVGSGLGYITGSGLSRLLGAWQWALRFTPALGVVAVLLILFAMRDPERGLSEGKTNLVNTPWLSDLKLLCKNRSFIFSTAGFTCVTFVTGALGWWGPIYIHLGLSLIPGKEPPSEAEASFMFGIIAMLTGVLGVPLGAGLSMALSKRFPRSAPIICGAGLLISAPLILGSLLMANKNAIFCYCLIFFGELALNLNWAVIADILLSVVIPTRRSTAEAFQILFSHAFGDAGSPYLVGLIADAIENSQTSKTSGSTVSTVLASVTAAPFTASNSTREDIERSFYALQYSLFTTIFADVLGGVFFLLTAIYILRDQREAQGDEGEQPRIMYADEAYRSSEQARNLVT